MCQRVWVETCSQHIILTPLVLMPLCLGRDGQQICCLTTISQERTGMNEPTHIHHILHSTANPAPHTIQVPRSSCTSTQLVGVASSYPSLVCTRSPSHTMMTCPSTTARIYHPPRCWRACWHAQGHAPRKVINQLHNRSHTASSLRLCAAPLSTTATRWHPRSLRCTRAPMRTTFCCSMPSMDPVTAAVVASRVRITSHRAARLLHSSPHPTTMCRSGQLPGHFWLLPQWQPAVYQPCQPRGVQRVQRDTHTHTPCMYNNSPTLTHSPSTHPPTHPPLSYIVNGQYQPTISANVDDTHLLRIVHGAGW